MRAEAPALRTRFSFARVYAIALKEFVQMRRDRLTFAMIVGIPIIQVLLFGFVINADPKSLPTALVDYDRTEFTRSIAATLANTGYFAFVPSPGSAADADAMLARGEIQFAIVFPAGFRASCCAANGRRRWWRPTQPILRRPATRSRRWGRLRPSRSPTT